MARSLRCSVLTLACFVAAVATTGCGKQKKLDDTNADSAKPGDSAKAADTSAKSDDPKGAVNAGTKGRFTYKVDGGHDSALKRIEPLFTSGHMEGIVKSMGVFALPKDVPVIGTDGGPCQGKINAFYSPDKHAVFFCYAFSDAIFDAFTKAGKNPMDASKLTQNAMSFLTFHEMGHALIAELGLAVTGKEEDAVDELAALILIDNKKPEWAVEGTLAMTLLTANMDKSHPAYFDEHSLSPQRLGDILCMIYGSDPKRYADMEKEAEIKPRLTKCPGFYQQKEKAWTAMLAPHERKGDGG